MLIGAGKEKIPFPKELFPIENYSGVHDDVYVRVMLFQSGTPFAIVCFDMASLRPYAIEHFRKETEEVTGIPKEQVWACVTHTFSVPHLRSEEALAREGGVIAEKNQILFDTLSKALERALEKAMASTEEVKLGYGHAFCSVNVNRDIYTVRGWWLGANDMQDSDKTIPFVRIDNLEGEPKAILYGYDVQSSVLDHYRGADGFDRISGDLAGASCRFIEEKYGEDFVALFLIGAAGDQAPVLTTKNNVVGLDGVMEQTDYGDAGFDFTDILGKKLGSQVLQASENVRTEVPEEEETGFCRRTVTCPGQRIAGTPDQIHPTKVYDFEEDEPREVELSVFTVGQAVLAGLGPELSSTTAMDIRGESPYPVTLIATLVNGGDKYMPESSAYDRITYEAMNSKFARGSAEKVKEALIGELKNRKGGKD